MIPYSDFKKLTTHQQMAVLDTYKNLLTERRVARLNEILDKRTRYITVVSEDLYDTQNSSALIRHCEAFGVQDYHIIENNYPLKIKKHVVRGTAQWVNLKRYKEEENNSLKTLQSLKKEGYRILATDPDPKATPLSEWDPSLGKTAFVFGNEHLGISDSVRTKADGYIHIPMHGFVESLNISACCAILLNQAREKLEKSGVDTALSPPEREEIFLQWLDRSIKKNRRITLKKDLDNLPFL